MVGGIISNFVGGLKITIKNKIFVTFAFFVRIR
jgi:hypothetical protein